MKSVVALDKYTVAFKFAGVSEESITETLQGAAVMKYFEFLKQSRLTQYR